MIGAIPAALPRAHALVDPALRDALAGLAPEVRRVAEYHAGFVDATGRASDRNGGKAIRPALALLSAEAAGAPAERAIPAAVAVELVHDFSLLHDDVMDGDLERRHRPAAWAVFGIGRAIVAGDALLALAQDLLLRVDGDRGVATAAALLRATERMIDGQSSDLGFETRDRVSTADCVRMAGDKTGALLGCAASIGALLVGAPPRLVSELDAFGTNLGISFQAIDDVLGIWGDPAVTGKPVGSDLRQGKKTLPIVAVLERGGPRAGRLTHLLHDAASEAEIRAAMDLVEEGGGRAAALELADRHGQLAARSLDAAGLADPVHADLADLAAFVLRREF